MNKKDLLELSKSQQKSILYAMLTNKNKKWWGGVDFQEGKYFIGYSASARISELMSKYEGLFDVMREGKYRYVSINWQNKELVDLVSNMVGVNNK